MKSYSEIQNPNSTSRDEIINDFVSQSGMQRSFVVRMFESQQAIGKDAKMIKETFDGLLQTGGISESINLTEGTIKTIEEFNNKALEKINEFIKKNPNDGVGLLNLVANIITVRKPDFAKTTKTIDIFSEIPEIIKYREDKNLNESYKQDNGIKSEIALFESLKNVLQYNSSKFNFSYHVETIYQQIWNYLSREINDLTNAENLQSKSSQFLQHLLDSVLNDCFNPMHRSVDVVKHLTPDLQTLVFDLNAFIWNWAEKQDKRTFTMIRKSTYRDFVNATSNLASALWQSRKTSVFLEPEDTMGNVCGSSYNDSESGNINSILTDLCKVKSEYQSRLKNWNIEFHNLYFCIDLIKGCSVEFNIQTRPYVRDYVTKVWNLLHSCEHIINELNTISKFKN